MNVGRRTVISSASFLVGSGVVPASSKNNKINNLQTLLEQAIEGDGILNLPAGIFVTAGLQISDTLQIIGVAGRTKLVSLNGGPVISIQDAADVSINGVAFLGKDVPYTDDLNASALVMVRNAKNLLIEHCSFAKSPFSGLKIEGCSGRLVGNQFAKLGEAGCVAIDSHNLEISSNVISDIGNNGIQVFRSEVGLDGTRILNNRISNVANRSGGSGQYGNGINVFRAGNVLTSGNIIMKAAYSGIRYNSGSNCQIIGNTIFQTGETALYVEFAYEGAVVANNVIADVVQGISIVNYDVGGRLATCTGNLVRNANRGRGPSDASAHGIAAEADTIIANNVVEDMEGAGIWLGWGGKCRNLSAQGNIIRNCLRGITVSVSEGAGKMLVAGNIIDGSREMAIAGMDYKEVKTGDLGQVGAAIPAHVTVVNNIVT
jgi:uncharacterized secreted repeat protein (TIGR03808 family)